MKHLRKTTNRVLFSKGELTNILIDYLRARGEMTIPQITPTMELYPDDEFVAVLNWEEKK